MTDFSEQYLGRYYLSERLGEGGMAVVYKGYDSRLERDVAIKIIRSDSFPPSAIGEVLKRFEREAKSLAKLSHPNIVKVHDYGEHEGSPYLVMEYLPGGTLKKILGKPVPWQDAVRLILPVARGVAYAHHRGVLHRDIKPANILITESGEPMLSDFGIAKLFEGDQATALTGSGMAIGTPEYMAPEQWTGIASPQSDLYSLGIVLYEMITGRKPYVADTPAAILIKQATEPLPRPRKFIIDLPESLELVLINALAREPKDRYRDINALIGALENFLVGVHGSPSLVNQPLDESHQEASLPVSLVSISTEMPVNLEGATRKVVDTSETSKIEGKQGLPTSQTRLAPSLKFSRRRVTGLLLGGIIIVLAAWLGSPLVDTWFSPAPVGTEQTMATLTLTFPPITPSRIVESSPTPTEIVNSNFTATVASLPTEITDAKGVSMVLISAGEFIMGSDQGDYDEKPSHTVILDAFYIDKYEVTNAHYKVCVDEGDCTAPFRSYSQSRSQYYGNSDFDNYPVIFVNWEQSASYCMWRGSSLPTEAEWEKAARGANGSVFPWGDTIDFAKANFCPDGECNISVEVPTVPVPGGYRFGTPIVSSDFGDHDTSEVGTYDTGVSVYGVFDLAGNVSEWVADWHDIYDHSASEYVNPLGPDSGIYRIVRGGAWLDARITSFDRIQKDPTSVNNYIGFRCARNASP